MFRLSQRRNDITMANINLEDLSVEELAHLKSNIDHAISNRRQVELLEARNQLDELVENSGFTLQEILDAKPIRKPVLPKYRNPSNPESTWTGRGRRPVWVEQCLSEGKTLEDLMI